MNKVLTTGDNASPAVHPRIYVACLAAYNSGYLHGAWIDADQEAAGIEELVRDMFAHSPVPLAEEWAIHDYEGFGDLRLSEWESFERVAAIGAGMAEHGLAFAAWLSYDSSHDPSDVSSFEDAYCGEWDSLRAYAEDFAESTGLYDIAEKAGSHYIIVDIDMLERDLDIEMYSVESEHGVYVFNPNT
jgi:antirestriction protein